jgi:AraC-like DNA-binding protein
MFARLNAMSSAPTGRLYFSTDALPQRDRFPMFCEEVVRRYAGLDANAPDQASFHAALELQRAGAINIGHISASAFDSARTASLVRDGDDSLIVALLTQGNAYQTQRNDDQVLASGDVVICDCGYPGALNFISDAQFWDIRIPRQKLAALLPRTTRFAGMRLDRRLPAHHLLFGYLDSAFALDLGGRAAELYGDHVVDLIALALGAEGDARKAAEARGGRAAWRDTILHEIERRSGDPALNAVAVALVLGVTPRYVHLLLEETGKSFTHHLSEKRLEKAGALLRDPRWSERRIADIALAAGFTDLSYFNRTFRRCYGATPSDVRERAAAVAPAD